LAIAVCKLLIFAGKLFGKHGSSAPGMWALRIAPDLLAHLAPQVRKSTIAVCGTNGKTTTNNFIYTLLRAQGSEPVCNRVGANMLYGVVTAYAKAAKISSKLDADYACIEIDELSAVKVFQHFKPDFIIMTNLFRDQLDRYGEIDLTYDSLRDAIALAKGATLILNADDPLLAALGKQSDSKSVYFGVADIPAEIAAGAENSLETKEGRFCRFCGKELVYETYYYSQLGRYTCTSCDFSRPALNYGADNINLSEGITFDIGSETLTANYRGFYNIYNMLAAFAVLKQCGISTTNINEALAGFRPQIGRMETFTVSGKPIVLNLSKNPAGFNLALTTVITDPREKAVVIVINDNDQDGCDVSWLWDVDFERLCGVSEIVVSGLRANDMLVRMKYAGKEGVHLEPKVKDAISLALNTESEIVYALVNYTALFSTQELLRKMEQA